MILMDWSGWIEVAARGPRAGRFREYLESGEQVLVPAIVVYEVYKVVRRGSSEAEALAAASRLKVHSVVPLDDTLALEAADASLRFGLPMADAIVYATAQAHGALLVTADEHFVGLPGVEFVAMGEE